MTEAEVMACHAPRVVLQGREITGADIELIRVLMAARPAQGRTPLSQELCRRWNWRNAQGRLKDMAARTLLLKLERAGHIRLPPRRRPSSNGLRNRQPAAQRPACEPIRGVLSDLRPLSVSVVAPGSEDACVFNGLLAHEHYLGHRNTVGETFRYLVRDRYGRPVACALFGSAAWKSATRDGFLGWDRPTRECNLQRLTNNTRFLIPGWVQVPHPTHQDTPGTHQGQTPFPFRGLSGDRHFPDFPGDTFRGQTLFPFADAVSDFPGTDTVSVCGRRFRIPSRGTD